MTTEALVKRSEMDSTTLTAVVTDGDCSRLTPSQRLEYYRARCEAAGLDPRTAPFMFTKLNGKLVLYALKSATDQLASNNRVQTTIIGRETIEGVYCVTVRATAGDGRSTEDVGAVQIGGLKGEALANALMKSVTKAKRRAVLSLCGLGMLDETEVQDVQAARPEPIRGSVKDEDEQPLSVEPPHDPDTGEVTPDRTADELAATALVVRIAKFKNEFEKKNWAQKHKPEIEALKARHPDLYESVKAAYDAAKFEAANAPQGAA